MKIGIFGGTFNPIHYGHLRAAEEARETIGLDKILFMPSGNPPLKTKEIADAVHRYKMTHLAVLKNRLFGALDIECNKPERSYTVDTLELLQKIYSGCDLYFMLGIDAFLDLPGWREPEKLLSLVNFAILSRPDYKFIDLLSSPYLDIKKEVLSKVDKGEKKSYTAKLLTNKKLALLKLTPIGISSTGIRRRIKKGLSIKYMLPEEIESYIISNRVYK